jgi:glycosyltransferase involved in cell wall biosynthesis
VGLEVTTRRGEGKRLRVLTLVDGIGAVGGGEWMARQIAMRLDPERFSATLCVTRWNPVERDLAALREVESAGVGFIGLRRKRTLALAPWRELLRASRGDGVDVVHAHKFGSSVWAALLVRRLGAPVLVCHDHGWSYGRKSTARRMVERRLIAARADAIIAVSRSDATRMVDAQGFPAAKMRFVANGIASRAPEPRADVRAELGIEPGAPVIGAVATLRPEKRLDLLIEAAGLLAVEFPDLRVLVAGGPDGQNTAERDRLRAMVSELGLERTVSLLGFRSDVPAVLAAIDVAVLCSDREASPLVVLEYMDAGKPLVATGTGGIPEMVSNGEEGLLVEPGSASGLAAAIERPLRDRALAARLGDAARERRRRQFDIARTVDELEALYVELYERKLTTADGG